MTSLTLEIILALVGISGAAIMLISMILLRLTLTSRLKKDLESKGQYWHSGTVDFDLINTAIFGWACVIPHMHEWRNFKNFYDNLDVRSCATTPEKLIAIAMIGGLAIFLFCGIWWKLLRNC